MRVATDIGGTFTDLVYVDENGHVGTSKSHTTSPHFEQGVVNVIEKSCIDQTAIERFIHGTTVIINALTERTGVKTGLITTHGFRDVLEIARGNRPDLFNIRYEKPVPFVERYLRKEVTERLNYKGEIVTPLDEKQLRETVKELIDEGVEAIAVVYLHSYINPVHEIRTKEIIQEIFPDVFVSISNEVTWEWREYERTNTTALNAYVKPIATTYIDKLETKLNTFENDSYNYIMQSNGGTTTFNQAKETPINLVESGPVAGIFGAAVLGELIGEKNIIAFDIGGTTAKCSLIENGEVKVDTEYYIERDNRTAGYPIKVPVVDIVEIGNGGGSIARLDHAGSLKVGPQSAGASPGPVSYGQGGTEPTTTDGNLYTGRLSGENFDYTVDMMKVEQAITEKIAGPLNISPEEAALGIIRIANSNMLNALKLISVRKGRDPREFSMIAFGGGGPMHAPFLAKELGMKKVIIPLASSVFSAWGMLMTDLRKDYIQTYIKRMDQLDLELMNEKWFELEDNAKAEYAEENVKKETLLFSRFVDMRYVGQEHTVKVAVARGDWTAESVDELIERFHQEHEKNYTYRLDDTPTEIVNIHLIAFSKVEKPTIEKIHIEGNIEEAIKEVRPIYYEEIGWVDTNVYDRENLPTLKKIEGPAIVEEESSVTVIYDGQTLYRDEYSNLIIDTGVN